MAVLGASGLWQVAVGRLQCLGRVIEVTWSCYCWVTRLTPQPLENADRRLDGNGASHRHGGSEVYSVWSVVAVVKQASKQHCVVSRTHVAPFESSFVVVAAFEFGKVAA